MPTFDPSKASTPLPPQPQDGTYRLRSNLRFFGTYEGTLQVSEGGGRLAFELPSIGYASTMRRYVDPDGVLRCDVDITSRSRVIHGHGRATAAGDGTQTWELSARAAPWPWEIKITAHERFDARQWRQHERYFWGLLRNDLEALKF